MSGPFDTETGLLEVTDEMAEGVHRFIAALKPGVYIKCSGCKKLKQSDTIHMAVRGVYCEGCA